MDIRRRVAAAVLLGAAVYVVGIEFAPIPRMLVGGTLIAVVTYLLTAPRES